MKLPTGWWRPSSPSKRANLLLRQVLLRLRSRSNILDRGLPMLGRLKSPKLLERAKLAAKQMSYFRLFSQNGSFEGLAASAKRAGFEMAYEDALQKVAGFRWAADGAQPDFIFLVSFENSDAVSVIAESQRDIFGLIMISHSHLPKIGIEIKRSLERYELGRNAHRFREILLTFPDFEAVAEELIRFQI
jgi:hypothetical protein